MYRRLCLLIVCALLVGSCHHSTPEQKLLLAQADSLMQSRPDSSLRLLRKITNYKQLAKADMAFYALLMSKALSKNDIEVESDSLIRIATDYYGDNDPVRAGYSWFYLSRCEKNIGNINGQAAALLKAQEYATKSIESTLLGHIWNDKAVMYQDQKQLDSMYYYAKLAYHAFQKQKDHRNAVVCLLNIGVHYSIAGKVDSALLYYLNASNVARKVDESLLISSAYQQLSYAYYKKGNYQKAIQYSRLSAKTSDSYDYSKWINLSYIYLKMGKLDSAQFYLRKSKVPFHRLPDYLEIWEGVCEKQGKFQEALNYEKRLAVTKDALHKQALSESFAGLEKKYNFQKYLSENKTLTIRNQSKNIVILVLLLLMMSGSTLFFIFKSRQHRLLLEQQRQLTATEEELLKHEQENNLVLKKQFDIQQNALIAISYLKQNASVLIKEQGIFTNPKQKKEYAAAQDEAMSTLYKNVIESIDLLYNNISKRLADSYPDLLESDILICCLLLAGFDNVSIASLLDILPKSYNMRRTALRKKLNIPHEINLNEFLVDF